MNVLHETVMPEQMTRPAQAFTGETGGGWVRSDTAPASGAFTPAAGGGFWVKGGSEAPAVHALEPGGGVHPGTPWDSVVSHPGGEANTTATTTAHVSEGNFTPATSSGSAGGWNSVIAAEHGGAVQEGGVQPGGNSVWGGVADAQYGGTNAQPAIAADHIPADGGGGNVTQHEAMGTSAPLMHTEEVTTPPAPVTAGSEASFGWVKVDTPPPSGSYTPAPDGGFWVRGGSNGGSEGNPLTHSGAMASPEGHDPATGSPGEMNPAPSFDPSVYGNPFAQHSDAKGSAPALPEKGAMPPIQDDATPSADTAGHGSQASPFGHGLPATPPSYDELYPSTGGAVRAAIQRCSHLMRRRLFRPARSCHSARSRWMVPVEPQHMVLMSPRRRAVSLHPIPSAPALRAMAARPLPSAMMFRMHRHPMMSFILRPGAVRLTRERRHRHTRKQ